MNKELILTIIGKLVLASANQNDKELNKILVELTTELQHETKEKKDDAISESSFKKEIVGFLKFTDKEISKMKKDFSKSFIANGRIVHYRKRVRGKNSCSYEVRYRRDGYNISVSAPNLRDAKQRFLETVNNNNQQSHKNITNIPMNFDEFAHYYFQHFRVRKVTAKTFKLDIARYNKHILPYLKNFNIDDITPLMCQQILDGLISNKLGKTADEIHSLLNQIFKSAIHHGIIRSNPIDIVFFVPHERKHGTALTIEEEKLLLSKTSGSPYQLMFAVALYTGLRPNELYTAKINGKLIIAKNSKRKNAALGKIEYKRIPINPMLIPFLEGVTDLKFYVQQRLREKFKKILPNHHLYDLRTTFYTRCEMCGVAQPARDEFMGHSSGKLNKTYSDLPDDYLIKEAKKIKY